jgi:hypothetical protein
MAEFLSRPPLQSNLDGHRTAGLRFLRRGFRHGSRCCDHQSLDCCRIGRNSFGPNRLLRCRSTRLAGWLAIDQGWYLREIRNLKGERQSAQTATKLAEGERDIQRRQNEGLKQAMLERWPSTNVLAMELAYGDPEVREIVKRLAGGEIIETPTNPLHAAGLTVGPIDFTSPQIKELAAVAYTTGVGLSKVEVATPVKSVVESTGTTASVNAAAQSFFLKLDNVR